MLFRGITAITVIWDEHTGETTVFSPAISQAHSPPFYPDGIVFRMLLPRGCCLYNLTAVLAFMFSKTSAIARTIFYMLDSVALAIRRTQGLLLLCTP